MSYEKLGFVSGQTLKAEHLNHIEDGIASVGGAGGVLGVVFSWTGASDGVEFFSCNKSYQEIVDALENGTVVIAAYRPEGGGSMEYPQQEMCRSTYRYSRYVSFYFETICLDIHNDDEIRVHSEQ